MSSEQGPTETPAVSEKEKKKDTYWKDTMKHLGMIIAPLALICVILKLIGC